MAFTLVLALLCVLFAASRSFVPIAPATRALSIRNGGVTASSSHVFARRRQGDAALQAAKDVATAAPVAEANQLDLFGELMSAVNGTEAEMLAAAMAVKDRIREPFFVAASACIHAQYPDDVHPDKWEQRDRMFKLMATLHMKAAVPTPSPVALLLCQLVQTDNFMERNKSLFEGLRFLENGCSIENAMLAVADMAEDVERECQAASNDNPLAQYPEVLEDMFSWFQSSFGVEYDES